MYSTPSRTLSSFSGYCPGVNSSAAAGRAAAVSTPAAPAAARKPRRVIFMWQAHYPDDRSSAMALTTLSIVLWVLFAASGAAALIYEIVWQQLLQLVIGSSTVSLGVLLGMFMGGMCLGSLYAPRLLRQRNPLRVYAALELAIGASGLVLLVAMPVVERFYTTWGGNGFGGLLLRAAIAAGCLLPPTFAMGATLPVISTSL